MAEQKVYFFTTGNTMTENIDGYVFYGGAFATSDERIAKHLRHRSGVSEIVEAVKPPKKGK
jgi:hypothetical protein